MEVESFINLSMKKRYLSVAFLSVLGMGGMKAQNPYTIYPIPQQQVALASEVSFSPKVTLVADSGVDDYTIRRAKQVLTDHGLTVETAAEASADGSNVYLGVNGQEGKAESKATGLGLLRDVFSKVGKYNRHMLSLFDEGGHASVVVIGENTDATFFGLASLEQILDKGTSGLKGVTIYDYADQQSRGLVEGYYGYPYSVDVKKDLMRFMMRYKMNTYLYGAKSDPYHSEYWKDAYPTTITAQQKKNGWLSQDMFKEVTEVSHETKVNFIWAIHPGSNFVSSSTVVNDIMGKFNKMYALGVRQFAVFVDDVGVPTSDADLKANADHLTQLQHALETKYNKSDAAPSDTVRPLHFVPQIYCASFAPSVQVRKNFFKALSTTPENVIIYTTGNGVWSVPNSADLNTVKTDLGRNVQWWWNYPCNDNADGQIYPMDMYSNFYDMPAVSNTATLPAQLNNGLGIVSNPMQQGEVAKTPLFSVADYAWNNAKFNNQNSWEQSFKAVLPGNAEAQAAYRYLAPYLRYNDPDALNQLISNFKNNGTSAELVSLMQEIGRNCEVLMGMKDSEQEGERLLYSDLAPWLLKLHAMAKVTEGLLGTSADHELTEQTWEKYLAEVAQVNELSTAEDFKAYALEGMGSSISVSVRPSQPSQRYLLGFIDYLKTHSMDGAFPEETKQKNPVSVSNVEGLKVNISGSTKITLTQGTPFTLHKGEYVGCKMPEPTYLKNIEVSDTLLANYSVVMSADGKNWTRLTQAITEPSQYVHYVAVVNDKCEPVTLRLTAKSIAIRPMAKTTVRETTIPDGAIWNGMTKDKMTDKDYTTFVCLNRNQQSGDAYTLKLSASQPIYQVRVGMGTVNGDYMTVGRVQISADGKTWTSLKVKGTNTADFKMTLPQVTPISDEVSICDFDGAGKEALYVRLYLTTPNTSKWLRLYEIEVNGDGAYTQARCVDGNEATLAQAYDNDASTCTSGAGGNELLYHFQKLQNVSVVTLYNDPSTMDNAEIEVSRDGENWISKGKFTSSIQKVDLSDMSDAVSLRVRWTGKVVPAVYEIVETADEMHLPTVTEIESVVSGKESQAASAKVVLDYGVLKAESAVGISQVQVFALNGKLLLTQCGNGACQVSVPVLHTAEGACIVRLTLADGEVVGYKVK